MNPGTERLSRTTLTPARGWYQVPTAPNPRERMAEFERMRRQEMLTPAALAMVVLALSGFLPATRPTLVPALIGGLAAVIVVLLLTIALNQAGHIRTATGLFIAILVGFYAVALFFTPSTPHGQVALTRFTAGSLYYFLAGVLPVFAAPLLADMPWPLLVNLVVFGMDMVCIWVLPHDATFVTFTGNLGGPISLPPRSPLARLC